MHAFMGEKKPKNIMDDVLYGLRSDKSPKGPPEAEMLDSFIHRNLDSKLHKRLSMDADTHGATAQRHFLLEQHKKRTTIYLSPETYEQLAASKDLIRAMLPEGIHIRVSMSGIADSALKILLKELEVKRKDSVLLKLMLRNLGKS